MSSRVKDLEVCCLAMSSLISELTVQLADIAAAKELTADELRAKATAAACGEVPEVREAVLRVFQMAQLVRVPRADVAEPAKA